MLLHFCSMKKYLMHTTFAPRTIARLLGLAIGLFLVPQILLSQPVDYGNAWYNPATNYLKIKVWRDGIYQISPQQLIQQGFDTTGIAPANLHLLYRGVEQYIHIDADSAGWYGLEFFGRRNDGGLDTLMYVNPYSRTADGSLHPNPNISTFSDTSFYYFYADNQPGLRLQSPFIGLMPPPVVREEYTKTSILEYHPSTSYPEFVYHTTMYDIFTNLNPDWTFGEGYVGTNFYEMIPFQAKIPTPHATNSGPAQLHLRFQSHRPWTQKYTISLNGNVLLVDTTTGLFIKNLDIPITSPLPDTSVLRVEVATLTQGMSSSSFMNLAAITYPASTELDSFEYTVVFPVQNTALEYYRFRNLRQPNDAVAHDLINHMRYQVDVQADSLGLWIPPQPIPGLIYLAGDSVIHNVMPIRQVTPSYLSATSNGANMVLITSRELATSAAAYKYYRQESATNPLNVKIVYTDEIYQEFGNGTPHPLAIKRFCSYALDHWAVKPDYFLIWGKGKLKIREGGINHVPVYGEPFSDHMYLSSLRRDTLIYRPNAAIGRVSILNDQQGLDFITKLATYEETPDAPWMRNGIFVKHGTDTTMLRSIDDFTDEFAFPFRGPQTVGRALDYDILDSALISTPPLTQNAAINQGASLLWMFGISLDLMGFNDLPYLANEGKYPVMIGAACYVNSLHSDTLSIGEQWVVTPNQGSIAMLAHSSAAYLIPSGIWGEALMRSAFSQNTTASIGEQLLDTWDTVAANWTDQVYLNHLLSMNLLGDPSIHFRTGTFEVWPGDANDDLIANAQDLLSIGLAYGDTGAVRPNASIQWMGYSAPLWDSTFANGTNHAHADCNGDGTIDANDTTAIVQNYGLLHNKSTGMLAGTANDPELAIESAIDTIPGGTRLELTVLLGSVEHPADSVYGLYGILPLDPELLDSTTFAISFDSCWLGTLGQNLLTMVHYSAAQGHVEFAITRTDHQPVSGHGEVARIGIVVIDNISGKFPGDTTLTPFVIAPSAAQMIDPLGTDLPLQGIAKLLFILGEEPARDLPADQQLAVFPNPTSGEIYVQTADEDASILRLYDPVGKLVREEHFTASAHKRLNMENLRAGVYILKINIGVAEYQVRITKVD